MHSAVTFCFHYFAHEIGFLANLRLKTDGVSKVNKEIACLKASLTASDQNLPNVQCRIPPPQKKKKRQSPFPPKDNLLSVR